jgi:hypothetical protein
MLVTRVLYGPLMLYVFSNFSVYGLCICPLQHILYFIVQHFSILHAPRNLNPSCISTTILILLYFIRLTFSLISISTTFNSFNFNIDLEFYLHLVNIICELQFIKINNSFTFFYYFLFSFPFFLPSFISSSFHLFLTRWFPVIPSLSLLEAPGGR